MKKGTHMSIFIDAEEIFDKIKNPFVIKTQAYLEEKRTFSI